MKLSYHLARFSLDATPPIGHPLCGGWIKATEAIDDPLLLRGVVLLENGPPIVIAALDWTGVLNESYRIWTEALAEAAHTTPDRVVLHSAHQHNAPFIDHVGNRFVRDADPANRLFDEAFVEQLIARSAMAVRESLDTSVPVTHVSSGMAQVDQVASNRRVMGDDGKVKHIRYSATKDPEIRNAPEGTIDPTLRSVTFHQEGRHAPLARFYYYTTHPMSYYADGRVTSDFVGLARQGRDDAEPETLHLYFTGCAGNITAGKYNDGAPENRVRLTDRVHRAMVAADSASEPHRMPLEQLTWHTVPVIFQPNEALSLEMQRSIATNPQRSPTERNHAAMAAAWLERLATNRPVLLSKLVLPGTTLLHLPGETFVEYQLEAQRLCEDRLLCTAAYGDGGPWYIPLERSFDEGGYEPTEAFASRHTESLLKRAITELLNM
jgi:hypothetical protein